MNYRDKMFADDLLLFLSSYNAEHLFDRIVQSLVNGTADVYIDGKIVGVVLWELSPSKRVAYIHELYINSPKSVAIMRWFGKRGKDRFPSLKYIKFIRGFKFDKDKPRIHRLDRLIKE